MMAARGWPGGGAASPPPSPGDDTAATHTAVGDADVARQLGRVILHVDLDAFYVQVEEQRHPELAGKPMAVQQWTGIIAVGYAARRAGVTRFMKINEAKRVCPDLELVHVDVVHDKVSLEAYRAASRGILAVMTEFGVCEKASVDEAYLDITRLVDRKLASIPDVESITSPAEPWRYRELDTFSFLPFGTEDEGVLEGLRRTLVVGYDGKHVGAGWRPESRPNRRLLAGAYVASEIRRAVEVRTGYRCSAGVSHNKLLAKIGSGMNKPAGQALLPFAQGREMVRGLAVRKVPGLGGKLGGLLEAALGCPADLRRHRSGGKPGPAGPRVADVLQLAERDLARAVGPETARWLGQYLLCIDDRGVEAKGPPRSLLEAKTRSKHATDRDSVRAWIHTLSCGLAERMADDSKRNRRWPRTLTLSMRLGRGGAKFESLSRSCGAPPHVSLSNGPAAIDELTHKLTRAAMTVFDANCGKAYRIGHLGLSVSYAATDPAPTGSQATLSDFFSAGRTAPPTDGGQRDGAQQAAAGSAAVATALPALHTAAAQPPHEAVAVDAAAEVVADMVECPVCFKAVPAARAAVHVNRHFSGGALSGEAGKARGAGRPATTKAATKRKAASLVGAKKRAKPSAKQPAAITRFFQHKGP